MKTKRIKSSLYLLFFWGSLSISVPLSFLVGSKSFLFFFKNFFFAQTRCFQNSLQMSNESSASETTPLRPADERFNNLLQQTPPQSSSSTFKKFETRNFPHNNNNTNLTSSITEPTNLASTTVTLANHNNNNNSIQVHLSHQNHHHQHCSTENSEKIFIQMETNKRILYRVGLDVLILLCGKFHPTSYTIFIYLWLSKFMSNPN